MDIFRKFIKILEDVAFSYPLNVGRKLILTDKETDSSTPLWKPLLSLYIIKNKRRSEDSCIYVHIKNIDYFSINISFVP